MRDSIFTLRASPLQILMLETAVYYTAIRQRLAENSPLKRVRQATSYGFTALLLLTAVFGSVQLVRLVKSTVPPAAATTSASPVPRASKPVPAAAAAKPANPSLPASTPTRISIPSINMDAAITPVGLNSDGALDVPYYKTAGWYNGSPTPGEIGPSVIDGHVDSVYGLGVFWYIKDLHPGDKITISREDGSTVNFTVQKLDSYSQNDFPTDKVYGNIDYAGLRLITCHGTFSYVSHEYDQNLVVYAKADL